MQPKYEITIVRKRMVITLLTWWNSGSIQSSRVPGGGVTSLSRSWPLHADHGPRRGAACRPPQSRGGSCSSSVSSKLRVEDAGGRAELATRLRPGAQAATGCAGQRAGGCALGRRRRPGAPACAWSSGQTSFSPSVALGLVQRRRPPPPPPTIPPSPPLPPPSQLRSGSPAPPIPVPGGRLRGTAAT